MKYSVNKSISDINKKIALKTERDVELALQREVLSLDDFMALLSPVAKKYLEQMAVKSYELTRKRFGKTIDMYAPLYVSNECQNICTYCGFSFNNKIARITLNDEEIVKEAKAVRDLGFKHVLIVSGEANKTVGVDYFKQVIKLIKPYFSLISLEVQPLSQED